MMNKLLGSGTKMLNAESNFKNELFIFFKISNKSIHHIYERLRKCHFTTPFATITMPSICLINRIMREIKKKKHLQSKMQFFFKEGYKSKTYSKLCRHEKVLQNPKTHATTI